MNCGNIFLKIYNTFIAFKILHTSMTYLDMSLTICLMENSATRKARNFLL